jgi:hypothetical protein
MTVSLIFVTSVLVAVCWLVFRSRVGRTFLKYRGKRLATCPETNRPVVVEVAALAAAATAPFGLPRLRLKSCSRWPERANCDQPCMWQVRAAPFDTLLKTIRRRWYQGKACMFCRRPLDDVDSSTRVAVRYASGVTHEWREIEDVNTPAVLATSTPVCWDCHIIETFRRERPELIVERPWKAAAQTPPSPWSGDPSRTSSKIRH